MFGARDTDKRPARPVNAASTIQAYDCHVKVIMSDVILAWYHV